MVIYVVITSFGRTCSVYYLVNKMQSCNLGHNLVIKYNVHVNFDMLLLTTAMGVWDTLLVAPIIYLGFHKI